MASITITKVGQEPKPEVKQGATRKHKTFPRSSLKNSVITKVSDPAKSPKRKTLKHTIHLTTNRGAKKHRKTLKRKIGKMPDAKIRELVVKYNLIKNPKTPMHLQREMVEGGMVAGLISAD